MRNKFLRSTKYNSFDPRLSCEMHGSTRKIRSRTWMQGNLGRQIRNRPIPLTARSNSWVQITTRFADSIIIIIIIIIIIVITIIIIALWQWRLHHEPGAGVWRECGTSSSSVARQSGDHPWPESPHPKCRDKLKNWNTTPTHTIAGLL